MANVSNISMSVEVGSPMRVAVPSSFTKENCAYVMRTALSRHLASLGGAQMCI